MTAPRIALVPLDERPVTTTLPHQIGAVAGVIVDLPPAAALPHKRIPGDRGLLANWLQETAPTATAAVVSLETLGFGGLIPSRLSVEDELAVAARWELLRDLGVPVHASSVILRTPNADDADEEPTYFAAHGRALHAWSASLHHGQPDSSTVPAAVRSDFLNRRLRNHLLNLRALRLTSEGVLKSLMIGADDTAVWAVGSVELQRLRDWISWLELGDRARAYAGADEVGAVLVARVLAHTLTRRLTVAVVAADPDRMRLVPRYESRPLIEAVNEQVAACGAIGTDEWTKADLVVVVHPPDPQGGDLAIDPPTTLDEDSAHRTAALVSQLVDDGCRVTVADCGLPNGAHDSLINALRFRLGDWDRLAGFAGWNTASNSVGTAVAIGVAYLVGVQLGTFDGLAHARLLRSRLLEDWGWMAVERGRIRTEQGTDLTRHDAVAPDSPLIGLAESRLAHRLAELDPAWRLKPGSFRFPWARTAEVDFELEPSAGSPPVPQG